jgi:flagellar biosynthesis protein FlhB
MGGDNKTEKPTPKRLGEARKRGQVAKSQDLNSAIVLGGTTAILMAYGTYLFQSLGRITHDVLSEHLKHTELITPDSFSNLFKFFAFHGILAILPFMLGIMAIGIIANYIQVQFIISFDSIKPNFSKVLPNGAAFKRMFNKKAIVELIKGVLKMIIIGWVAWGVIKSHHSHLFALGKMGFAQAWKLVIDVTLNIAMNCSMALLVLGASDWLWQKRSLMKELMMTKHEVKEEMKSAEGNPEVKNKIKATGKAMIRQKMLRAVQQADVVVMNPTHFAVAIQYDPDKAPAPRVIAKGVDDFALKLKAMAKTHNVPIVENKPLARALHAAVEVDSMIPPDLFIAVAEVLAYVFRANKGRKKRAFGSAPDA